MESVLGCSQGGLVAIIWLEIHDSHCLNFAPEGREEGHCNFCSSVIVNSGTVVARANNVKDKGIDSGLACIYLLKT